jgi:hypothetical protein
VLGTDITVDDFEEAVLDRFESVASALTAAVSPTDLAKEDSTTFRAADHAAMLAAWTASRRPQVSQNG